MIATRMETGETHSSAEIDAASAAYESELRAFRRLRLAAVLAPLVLVVLIAVSHGLLDPRLSPWVKRLVVGSIAFVLIAVFYDQVFDRLGELQRELTRQNRELLALHQAGLAVVADLSLDSVLQKVVDSARALVGTRYGAISVVDDEGRIRSFLTSGVSEELHEEIGDLPRGRGLLGVVLEKGERLRLDDLTRDPRSAGFPPHHPEMRTLLAVPVPTRGPHRGNLYLSEKENGTRFTEEDEETLVRFASQAAVAIDNAYLHRQVRELGAAQERIRIAHEMHDGLAQVLAYVNTKAQVVREHLRQGHPEVAEEHLGQLAEASRSCYADVPGQILELRTAADTDKSLAEGVEDFVAAWAAQTGVATDVDVTPEIGLPPDAELQVLRILQESLTNVRKHAEASHVVVRLLRGEEAVRLVVVDDGLGLGEASERDVGRPRFGLTTMRERAESVGGELELTSSPGEGTRVEVEIPLARRNDMPPLAGGKEGAHATTHR